MILSEMKAFEERQGRDGQTLETESEYKNIGLYSRSLRPFLRILCVVDDFAGRRSFSALREDAFDALASFRSQSLVFMLWFNFCSQIIIVKHDPNSMLHKIDSVKEISDTYIYK